MNNYFIKLPVILTVLLSCITLNVQAQCTGTPNAGVLSVTGGFTPECGESSTITLTGYTNQANIQLQWQLNNGTGWTGFGAGTNPFIVTPPIMGTTQFRCVVVCTSAGGGSAISNVVTIGVLPIEVNIGNDTTICPGITHILDATNVPGSTYLWSNSATTPTINVTTPGSYRVRVTLPNGCIGRDTVNIEEGIQPNNFLAPNHTLCADSTLTLDAGNPGTFRYLWSPTSETSRSIQISNAGTYSVLITSEDNCELISTTQVTYRLRPTIVLPLISTICSVDSILLDATTALGHTYEWSNGANTPSVWIKDSALYSVVVTSEHGCPSWEETKVEFFPDPTTEGFTFIPYFYEQLGKVTFAPINPQAVNSYRWYFGDGDSSYQKSPTHVYEGNGIYLVTLVVVNHCRENEYAQNVHINLSTGIITTDKEMNILIYPNPAIEKITIENKNNLKITAIQIYNTAGTVVYQSEINTDRHEINIAGLAAGIYHIKVQAENNNWMVKKLEIVK